MGGITLNKVEIGGGTVQLFEDKGTGHVTGFRYSTGTYYDDPLSLLPKDFKPTRLTKTQEEIDEEIRDIETYPVRGVPSRNIKDFAMQKYNTKVGLSEADGESIVTIHFPYTKDGSVVGYKNKLLDPKKHWGTGVTADVDMFGWEEALQGGSPKLFITEGEMDAIATYQMLKDNSAGGKWAHLEPAVVSLPNGIGGAAKYLVKRLQQINKHFKDIVLVFDMDEPGRVGAKEVAKVIPSVTVAELPDKDANACLSNGRKKAFCNAILFNAKKMKNTRTVAISSLFEKAKTPAVMGMSFPWKRMTQLTRGIRFGETIYITGTAKIGKSDVLNTIVAHLIMEHDIKCFVCKPEEANVKSVKLLAGKVAGKIFHDPNVKFDEGAYDKATEVLDGKVELVNIYQNVEWETLKGDIITAAADGCKAIFIDPLTVLTTGMTPSDANTKLQEIAQNLSSLALDLDVVIFIFTHLKNPAKGDMYDRGGKINVGDITGSRGMTRSCNMILGIQGNSDPELEDEERNLRDIVLLSDREFGASGVTHLFWDKNTSLFKEL